MANRKSHIVAHHLGRGGRLVVTFCGMAGRLIGVDEFETCPGKRFHCGAAAPDATCRSCARLLAARKTEGE